MARTSPPAELLVRQRLKVLTRAFPAAQEGDARSLHEARVATRRLREALPLVASGARRRKLARAVRRLTRALGPVRELDVALQMLDELESAADTPRGAVDALRLVLEEERRLLRENMCRQLSHVDLARLERRLAAAGTKRRGGQHSLRREDRQRCAEQRVARRAMSLRAAIESAAGIYLPDRLHDVRIAVKKLRYALELRRQLRRSRAMADIRRLKGAQDLLGRMHDLEVLIARVRGMQGSPAAASLRLSAELDGLVRYLETECRRLHAHYMTARTGLLLICEGATKPPSRRRVPSAAA